MDITKEYPCLAVSRDLYISIAIGSRCTIVSRTIEAKRQTRPVLPSEYFTHTSPHPQQELFLAVLSLLDEEQ